MIRFKANMMVTALAVIILAGSACTMIADDSSASEAFSITYKLKGTEYTVNFDGPVDKVVVFGYAATLTVLDAGKASMIYAADEYGKEAFADKKIDDTSNSIPKLYPSTNADAIKTKLLQAAQDGKISKDSAIIFTTYETCSDTLRKDLSAAGFTHIVYYGTMNEFSDLIRCIGEIEKIVGSDKNLEKNMQLVYDTVVDKTKDAPKTDAIYLRYGSSGWGYGGSICSSMIVAGGGNNIGKTPDNKTVYDETKIVQLLDANPNAVIFLDDAWVRTYDKTVEDFVSDVMGGSSGNHQIVVVERTWNNYDPEAADGLWKMASVMHPDIISGDVPVYKDIDEKKDNTLIYIGAGVAVAIVLVGALFIMRMRK